MIFFVRIFRLLLAIPPQADGYSQCSMYAVNFTEMLENNILISDPLWPVQSCKNGWEYNFTEIPYSTIATEVCSNISSWNFKSNFWLFIYLTARLGLWKFVFANIIAINLLLRCNCRRTSFRMDCWSLWKNSCTCRMQSDRVRCW